MELSCLSNYQEQQNQPPTEQQQQQQSLPQSELIHLAGLGGQHQQWTNIQIRTPTTTRGSIINSNPHPHRHEAFGGFNEI